MSTSSNNSSTSPENSEEYIEYSSDEEDNSPEKSEEYIEYSSDEEDSSYDTSPESSILYESNPTKESQEYEKGVLLNILNEIRENDEMANVTFKKLYKTFTQNILDEDPDYSFSLTKKQAKKHIRDLLISYNKSDSLQKISDLVEEYLEENKEKGVKKNKHKMISEIMTRLIEQKLLESLSESMVRKHVEATILNLQDESSQGEFEEKNIEIDGRLYGLGDIVMVGYGPYFEMPKKQKGPRLKKDAILENVQEEQEIQDKDDEPLDIDDEADYEKGEGRNFGFGEDEEIEEQHSGETSDEVTGKGKGWTKEEGYEVVYKENANLFEGKALEIAKSLGLPLKGPKYIVQSYAKGVKAAPQKYKGYEKYKVVKNSQGDLVIVPYKPNFGTKVELLKADRMPPPVPKWYLDTKGDKSSPKKPKNYKGDLQVGDCVQFTVNVKEDIKGMVSKTLLDSFEIVDDRGILHKDLKYKSVKKTEVLEYPSTHYIDESGKNPRLIMIIGEEDQPRKFIFTLGISHETLREGIKVKNYVNVKLSHTREFRGMISSFEKDEFIVTLSTGGIKRVKFTEKTLEKAKKCELPKLEQSKVLVEDIYGTEVTQKIREDVVRLLFDKISKLKNQNILEYEIDEDVQVAKLREKVDWNLYKEVPKKWEQYYGENFHAWLYAKLVDDIRAQAPSFEKEAENYAKFESHTKIIQEISNALGHDIFNYDAQHIVDTISKVSRNSRDVSGAYFRPTLLYVNIKKELTRIAHDKNMKGLPLAKFISKVIADHLEKYPIISENVRMAMQNDWVQREFSLIRPDSYREEFESENLENLTKMYEEHNKKIEENNKKVKEYNDLKRSKIEKSNEQIDKLSDMEKNVLDGKKLNEQGVEILQSVSELENSLHELAGEEPIVSEYLTIIFNLTRYMSDEGVGKYSKFFQAKIKSGLYKVDNLVGASPFHTFPELFYNRNLTEDQLDKGLEILKKENVVLVNHFIAKNILLDNELARKFDIRKFEKDWSKIAFDLREECWINGRISTTHNLKGDEKDLDGYDCIPENEGSEEYICTAKKENIPLEDAILCKSNKGLVCMSLNDILHAIADQRDGRETINHVTGEPYEKDFLDRMKERYGDILEAREKSGEKFGGRVLEMKVHEDYVLFGEMITEEEYPSKRVTFEKSPKSAKSSKTKKSPKKSKKKISILYKYPGEWQKHHKLIKKKGWFESFEGNKKVDLVVEIDDKLDTPIFIINMKGNTTKYEYKTDKSKLKKIVEEISNL